MKLTDAVVCCDEQLYHVTDLIVDMTGIVIDSARVESESTEVCVSIPMPACKMRLLAKILVETADKMEGKA